MTHSGFLAAVISVLICVLWQIVVYASYKSVLRRNGCQEARKYPHKDPFLGIDYFIKFMNAFKESSFLKFNKYMFDEYGKTHTINSFGTKVFRTIDPEVSKAVHSTFFANFGLQGLRYDTATHLWGNGIIVVDGPHWKSGRALIRSSFDVVHIANMDRLRKHVETFLALLPQDSSTVDLAPLFKMLILDTSSEFIFGEAMGALQNSMECKDFMDAFEYAQRGTGIRAILRRLKFLHRDQKWWEACKQVTDYADKHVEQALDRLKRRNKVQESSEQHEPLRLIDEMARDTQDRVTLRSHILSVFSPAHDGAATTLTNVFFHLARNPRVWQKLKAEIEPTTNEVLNYELLNSYKYVEWVLKETHRLTTIATTNQRQCVKDTVLPFGGGANGSSPLFVQRGDMVEISYWAMGRDETFWGEDASVFKPERWETARPGWEYTPFGGGPRSCPGQRLVFTESAYVLVSLLRIYSRVENRDSEMEWKEELRLTAQSKNGCIVGLIPISH